MLYAAILILKGHVSTDNRLVKLFASFGNVLQPYFSVYAVNISEYEDSELTENVSSLNNLFSESTFLYIPLINI